MARAFQENKSDGECKAGGRPIIMPAVLTTCIAVIAGIVTVNANRVAESYTSTEKNYAEEISRTYDFKFGPNPFSPSNATTTTGTFVPGEMFVSAKRCGTCHTDAHAQWRQSAHGNAFPCADWRNCA